MHIWEALAWTLLHSDLYIQQAFKQLVPTWQFTVCGTDEKQ